MFPSPTRLTAFSRLGRYRWIVLCLLLAPLTLAQAQTPENLALRAEHIEASDGPLNHGARQAVDGDVDTYWAFSGSPEHNSWIELSWNSPVQVTDIVIRRRIGKPGTPDLTHLVIESFERGNWSCIGEVGDGKVSLAPVILLRVPPRTTQKLRLAGFDIKGSVVEIEVYSEDLPAWLDVRGDDRGNIIGALTDGAGAAGIETGIQASGQVAGKPWKVSAHSDASGEFTIPMPVGLTGPIEFSAVAGTEAVRKVVDAGDIQQGLVPADDRYPAIVLNGTWRFTPDPPRGFERPGFDDSGWPEISVPSHWAMQGFEARTGKGAYRRHVAIPPTWKGRRIRIAFDGVYSGAEVWWNGRRVGSHVGGATPFQLDVTDAARAGADNVVSVLVSEQSPASDMDHMSMYADFPLAGIFRQTRVFSVPPVHVARMQSHSEFGPKYRNAVLVAEISVVNESASPVHGGTLRLRLGQGEDAIVVSKPVAVDLPPWSRVKRNIRMEVSSPREWTAEHPNLYLLQTVISQGGNVRERSSRKIGFRETQIRKTSILVNGVPIKFKGTAHHDSHPLMGRAVTPELERKDLQLMKEANIDSIRTSHYPPLPELLTFADQLGLYVEDEAPFCWLDQSYDLRWGALTRQLTAELVERDMSHPSVAYWSAGNESHWGPILEFGVNEIRAHDPSRPVMGSWERRNRFDMAVRHNPITVTQIQALDNNDRPVVWDESLAPFQSTSSDGAALWRDPGYRDYYVAPLIAVMDAFWKSKVVQGSFIWAWSDDLFLVPNRGSEYGRRYPEGHGVDRTYHMEGRGLVGDAPWGVVDGWRRKKPEFWHVKNLYSPIHIEVRRLAVPSDGHLRVPIENRYFFTNLSELSVHWRIGATKGTIHPGIAPQTSGFIEIPAAALIEPGSKLELRFLKDSILVDIHVIQIGEHRPVASPAANAPPLVRIDQRLLSGVTPRIAGKGFAFGVSHSRGLIEYATTGGGATLYDQPQIHILPFRKNPPPFPNFKTWSLDKPSADISEHDGRVTITADGHYPHLKGTYVTTISPSGDVTVSYDFRYDGPNLRAAEIGLRIELPLSMDRLSWTRRGEWTWYPKDHIGALSGDVRAHSGRPTFVIPTWPYGEDDSAVGSNMYRSTKRNILEARVTDSLGRGWSIHSDGSQHLRASLESDCVAIYVNDWYGGTSSRAGEWTSNYGEGKLLQAGDHLRGTLRMTLLKGKADKPATN